MKFLLRNRRKALCAGVGLRCATTWVSDVRKRPRKRKSKKKKMTIIFWPVIISEVKTLISYFGEPIILQHQKVLISSVRCVWRWRMCLEAGDEETTFRSTERLPLSVLHQTQPLPVCWRCRVSGWHCWRCSLSYYRCYYWCCAYCDPWQAWRLVTSSGPFHVEHVMFVCCLMTVCLLSSGWHPVSSKCGAGRMKMFFSEVEQEINIQLQETGSRAHVSASCSEEC